MKPEDALDSAKVGLRELLEASGSLSWSKFGRRVLFYAPSFIHYEVEGYRNVGCPFASISITGRFCALNCEHCGGRLLNTMMPATSPYALFEACRRVKESGGCGVLISGGCLKDGRVPLERFLKTIGRVKMELKLIVVVHTGLVNEGVAQGLAEAEVDGALLDIIGNEETVKKIYHLDASIGDYEESLSLLEKHRVPMIPHVLIGLHYGELRGELKALEIIARHSPSALVLIALTPLLGTSMWNAKPPPPAAVARVLAAARFMMPKTPIALGCARPKGLHRNETDILALEAGVNAIAFPSEGAIERARSLRLKYSFAPTCCSQLYLDI